MGITVDEVCRRARKEERVNLRAYWATLGFTVLLAAAFVRNLIQFRDPWLIFGTAWALAALCYVSWRLFRNGPSRIGPAEPCVNFLRREFEGKLQGLLWFRWGILLFFPAILASWWGGGPVLRAKTLGVHSVWLLQLLRGPVPLVVFGLLLAFVSFAFSREAGKIRRELIKLRRESSES